MTLKQIYCIKDQNIYIYSKPVEAIRLWRKIVTVECPLPPPPKQIRAGALTPKIISAEAVDVK